MPDRNTARPTGSDRLLTDPDLLRARVRATVARRRRRGAYDGGLQERLDGPGRDLVRARSGPWGPGADTTPAPGARLVRLLHKGGRRFARTPPVTGTTAGHWPVDRLDILFVVQRYGTEVAGGAELHCRQFASRLAGRGHRVEVLTSRAVSANDWADHYPEGDEWLDGVLVHRIGVTAPRNQADFESVTVEVLWGSERASLERQRQWQRMQGPDLPDLGPWLTREVSRFDVVVHFSYLYTPTWAGLPMSARAAPTVLHATAHDEPAFWIPAYDELFASPTRYAWSTEEERDLLVRRGAHGRGSVIGVGVDLESPGRPSGDGRPGGSTDPSGLVALPGLSGLKDRPYVVFVGRAEAGKGADELTRFFVEFKRRHPGPLALLFVGPSDQRTDHPDLFYSGFVDDQTRADALAGARALMQPSFFESFSMVLTEAWAQGRPVLAQGHTDVLVGQVRRSRGGLYYRGYAEFEVGLELLIDHPDLASALGEAGRRYAGQHYHWDAVIGRYEELLRQATLRRGNLPPKGSPPPTG